jgi:hypothetical protein
VHERTGQQQPLYRYLVVLSRRLTGHRLRARRRSGAVRIALLCTATLTWSRVCLAQAIDVYFPQGNYGYDQQLGVTVQTRAHPLYEPLGIQVDSFNVAPRADESLFYNSNVNGFGNSASWGSLTSASISAGSDWSRDSLSATLGFAHYQYLSLPDESYTNWNVGLAGGYTIADSQLIAAYSHQSEFQLSTSLGAVRSETPVQNQTDSVGVEYTFNFDKLAITPNIGIGAYRFGSAVSGNVKVNQSSLDFNAFAAGVTARYALDEQSGVLVVVRGLDNSYISPQPGQPTNNSNSLFILGGIDYQAKGVWRYRLLAGLEVREFAASQFPTRGAPDIEASVVWSPTSLTTVDFTFSNTIEAPQTVGTNSYVLTQGRATVDHELRQNIFLQGNASIQRAQYLPSGTQTQLSGGAGISWLLNRATRLSLDYGFTTSSTLSGVARSSTLEAQTASQYTQNLIALTVHFAL